MATALTLTFTCDHCELTEVQSQDPVDWFDDTVINPPDGWDTSDGGDELCPTCLPDTGEPEDETQVDLGGGMVVPLRELLEDDD